MSIVAGSLQAARVLDLFAGSGALGLEALSRGAEHAVFVESHPQSIAVLEENARSLSALHRCTIRRDDALAFVKRIGALEYDVAFCDPPYGKGLAREVAAQWILQPFARLLGLEHAVADPLPGGGDMRRYGDTAVTFFRAG